MDSRKSCLMGSRALVLNKMSPEVVGGVESVVLDSLEVVGKLGLKGWVAYPVERRGLGIKVSRSGTRGYGIIECSSLFDFFGHKFSVAFLFFVFKNYGKFSIVNHQSPFPLSALMLSCLTLKNRLLVTYHAPIVGYGVIGSLMNALERFLFSRAKIVVFTSARLRRFYGCGSANERVVRLRALSPKAKHVSSSITSEIAGRRYLLFLGRVSPYKGVDLLVDSWRRIIDKRGYILVIVGREDSRCQGILATATDPSVVIIRHHVSRGDKDWLVANARWGVMPSVNDGEAFGIMQLEFMQAGVPVLNTWLNTGFSEVSVDRLTGYTVDANVSDIQSGLTKALETNDSDWALLSANCRQRVDEMFDTELFFKSLRSVLLEFGHNS